MSCLALRFISLHTFRAFTGFTGFPGFAGFAAFAGFASFAGGRDWCLGSEDVMCERATYLLSYLLSYPGSRYLSLRDVK